jgi:hypothetical protein
MMRSSKAPTLRMIATPERAVDRIVMSPSVTRAAPVGETISMRREKSPEVR